MLAPKQVGKVAIYSDLPNTAMFTFTGSIETYRLLKFDQTTPGLDLVIPTPTQPAILFGLDFINAGSADLFLNTTFRVPAGGALRLNWDGSAWVSAGSVSVDQPIFKGWYYPDTDETKDLVTRSSGGPLPAASIDNRGHVYIIEREANLLNWLSTNITPNQVLRGDYIISNGSIWFHRNGSHQTSGRGDTSTSLSVPTERSTTHVLEDGDLWYSPSTQDLKVFDQSNLSWSSINDPVSLINSGVSINSVKSQSFLVTDNDLNNTLILNGTPQDGEHVRVYFTTTSCRCIIQASLIGGGSSIAINYGAGSVDYVDFIFDPSIGAWKYYLNNLSSFEDGSNIVTNSLPAQPGAYTVDTIEIDSTVNDPLKTGKLYLYRLLDNTYYSDLLVDRSRNDVSSTEVIPSGPVNRSPTTNKVYYVVNTSGTTTFTLDDGVYDGQTISFIRGSDWATNSFILKGTSPTSIVYPSDNTITGNDISRIDLYWDATGLIWNAMKSSSRSSPATSDFKIKGWFFPDQDRIDDITSGSTIGTLPVSSASNHGDAYIVKNSVSASSWATVNMPAENLGQGDIVLSMGSYWMSIHMTDSSMGHGDIQVKSTTPTIRSYRGNPGLRAGDLWINSTNDTLSYYDSGWKNVATGNLILSGVKGSFGPTTKDSLYLVDPAEFISYYRGKVYGYDSSAAASLEVGKGAFKAETLSNGSTLSVTNQNVHILVNTDSSSVTINLPASPEEGHYIRIISGNRGSNPVLVNGNGKPFNGVVAAATYSMASTIPMVTLVYNFNNSRWDVREETTGSATPSYSEGLLSARPASGTVEGDMYRVAGDTPVNNGRTFVWDSTTSTWNELGSDMFDSGLAASRPATALDGFMYYATDTGVTSVYSTASSSWRTVGSVGVSSSTNPSTDNTLARYDGTTGQIIQGSTAVLSDTGDLSGIKNIHNTGMATTVVTSSTAAPATVLNVSTGNFFAITVPTAVTWSVSFTGAPASGTAYVATLLITLQVTSGITFPASVRWPGGLTPPLSAGKTHLITLYTGNGGTTWYATYVTDYA